MSNARYAVTPIVGSEIDARSSTALFALGTTVWGTDGDIFVYGQANGAVSSTCTLNESTFQITDAAGDYTADVAFADDEYGFIRRTTKLI